VLISITTNGHKYFHNTHAFQPWECGPALQSHGQPLVGSDGLLVTLGGLTAEKGSVGITSSRRTTRCPRARVSEKQGLLIVPCGVPVTIPPRFMVALLRDKSQAWGGACPAAIYLSILDTYLTSSRCLPLLARTDVKQNPPNKDCDLTI
jgi:hypothetical protein